ncbi:hypothetical protein JTB14_013061 [Gonioctena quinquepunctata]|nr:hypothetical protein JTB14_013061 [Gonioctena quinquepunctata]
MHPDDPNFGDWCVEQLRDDDNLISDDDQSIIMESEQSGYEDVEEENEKNIIPAENSQYFFYGPALGDIASPIQVWDTLFSEDMWHEVIQWINRKLSQCRAEFRRPDHTTLRDIDSIEMRAFLRLLIYTEVFKAGRESIEGLLATDGTGRDTFRYTMPRRRFDALLIASRSDNDLDRSQRIEEDGAGAISGLFKTFIHNSQRNYSLGAYVCVDESLVPLRKSCRFKILKRNRSEKSSTLGATAIAQDLEAELAANLQTMKKWGFGMFRKEVLQVVSEFVQANNLQTPFKDNFPDIAFATELLNTALQRQSKSCVSEDIEEEQDGGRSADGENTADTTDPDESLVTGENSEVGSSTSKETIATLLGKRLKQKEEHEHNKAKR